MRDNILFIAGLSPGVCRFELFVNSNRFLKSVQTATPHPKLGAYIDLAEKTAVCSIFKCNVVHLSGNIKDTIDSSDGMNPPAWGEVDRISGRKHSPSSKCAQSRYFRFTSWATQWYSRFQSWLRLWHNICEITISYLVQEKIILQQPVVQQTHGSRCFPLRGHIYPQSHRSMLCNSDVVAYYPMTVCFAGKARTVVLFCGAVLRLIVKPSQLDLTFNQKCVVIVWEWHMAWHIFMKKISESKAGKFATVCVPVMVHIWGWYCVWDGLTRGDAFGRMCSSIATFAMFMQHNWLKSVLFGQAPISSTVAEHFLFPYSSCVTTTVSSSKMHLHWCLKFSASTVITTQAGAPLWNKRKNLVGVSAIKLCRGQLTEK